MASSTETSPFGLTLQLLRQQRDLSINGLGRAAGVDPAYLWRLERGEKQDPSVSVLRKICDGLNLSPQQFLTQLLTVEEALASGHSIELPEPPVSDADEAIFADIVTQRAQKESLRAATGLLWQRIEAPGPGKPGRVITIPKLGRIAAGSPMRLEDCETVDTLTVPVDGLAGDPDLFVLEVEGDSMIGASIHAGDDVIVSPGRLGTMAGGQIGACRLHGTEITLKHVWRTDEGYLLRANNPAYPDLEIAPEDCEILGVVVRILKVRGSTSPEQAVD